MNIIIRKYHGIIRRYKEFRIKTGVKFLDVGKDEKIEKPIFLLGVEGGGLTLLSRILHRNHRVVYVTGNYKYWAGQDEINTFLENVLPNSLTWRRLDNIRFKSYRYGSLKHGGIYAIDEVLPFYRSTSKNASLEIKKSFESIIKKIIWLNKPKNTKETLRFINKSQLYTVKVGLLQELLKEYNPKFVLIIRNPFAWCWRRIIKPYSIQYHSPKLSDKEWLELACQHWLNNFKTALSYKGKVDLSIWRFEDLLKNPEQIMSEICDFVELDFNLSMLPQADDKIPTASLYDAFTNKWYPLRLDVNKRYLKEIPQWAVQIIRQRCGDLAEKFNYSEFGP